MTTAHDALEDLRAGAASRFPDTALARDLADITRSVRRQRAVRAATGSALTIGIVGALVLSTPQLTPPGINPAISPEPTPASAIRAEDPMVAVAKGESAKEVAGDLGAAFGVSTVAAYRALSDALPKEALGSLEGWIAVGDYTFENPRDLRVAAREMVGATVIYLIAIGVAHEDWNHVVVLASIAEQEAPAPADQPTVVRVLLNRLDAKMPLAVESIPAYAARGLYAMRFTTVWPETQYDTYEHTGLPPTAIGASTREALEAAANPAQGDWLYFRRDPQGSLHVSTNNEKFATGPNMFFPSETQDD